MNTDNYVIFKGTKDGISILLKEDADFETLRTQLAKKVEDAAKFFNGGKTSIALKGKTLSEEQELELLNILSEKTNMNISFVNSITGSIGPVSVLLSDELQQLNITKFHHGSLRSGQSINFKGSVVIMGDINPGGLVKAEGNIIILGQLKGIAHAGCAGCTDAYIAALYMAPVQLRIADTITLFPEENKKGAKVPKYAYVEDGQIYVVPLT